MSQHITFYGTSVWYAHPFVNTKSSLGMCEQGLYFSLIRPERPEHPVPSQTFVALSALVYDCSQGPLTHLFTVDLYLVMERYVLSADRNSNNHL